MSESGVVYKTNSTGPGTEPCGTPNMREEEEGELLTTIHWFLSRRYDQNSDLHQTEKTKTNYGNYLLRILSLADTEDFNGEDGMSPLARPFFVDAQFCSIDNLPWGHLTELKEECLVLLMSQERSPGCCFNTQCHLMHYTWPRMLFERTVSSDALYMTQDAVLTQCHLTHYTWPRMLF